MDIRKIKKLIELVEESGITELEVSEEEGTVRISRAAPVVAAPAVQYTAAPTPVAAPAAAPAAPSAPAAPARYFLQWLVLSIVAQAQMLNHLSK